MKSMKSNFPMLGDDVVKSRHDSVKPPASSQSGDAGLDIKIIKLKTQTINEIETETNPNQKSTEFVLEPTRKFNLMRFIKFGLISTISISFASFIVIIVLARIDACYAYDRVYYCNVTKKCLRSNHICNKFVDCPGADYDYDENNCVCAKEEYKCNGSRCISRDFLCDDVRDCPRGDDEKNCAATVCGQRQLQRNSATTFSNTSHPYFSNPISVPKEFWPWFASLYFNGSLVCSAIVVSRLSVLAGGHCVENNTNNVVFIKLKKPILYNPSIQPICLPGNGNDDVIKSRVCVASDSGGPVMCANDQKKWTIHGFIDTFADKNDSAIVKSCRLILAINVQRHVKWIDKTCLAFDYQYTCNLTGACLRRYQICNRYQDCPDDSDESKCDCSTKEYKCNLGRCIPRQYLCDQVQDCKDGDDEEELHSCKNGVLKIMCENQDCGTRNFTRSAMEMNLTNPSPYIINGVRSNRGAWPWYAGLYYKNSLYCGGSIIVKVGGYPVLRNKDLGLEVDKVSIFNNAMLDASDNPKDDVGIIQLKKPLKYNWDIQPVCLIETWMKEQAMKLCIDIGHGLLSSTLLQARMSIQPFSFCTSFSENLELQDTDKQLCLGVNRGEKSESGLCSGDSGGPLICTMDRQVWYVTGINSYVLGKNIDLAKYKCIISIVYRVRPYVNWLKRFIEEED
ncbi:hypothetical protein HELRODRAFT_190121 [Helobdella robusta]|uniref:Peptidase S1 domain-containing protein n=1 Tax=Helobdella robusta TaxID=6412 RepID=T1FRP7_HELRO|nr:hypothetical protein HELRODRAFT_190121 [Helobdella robusta]ESO10643.1 hypothetical protein HELRODRAFT_190121 [Helobdella robusta]